MIHWYTGSCGGTSVGTGNGLSVSPAVTTTYYGRYEDGAPCNYTSACVTVTVTVNTKSADPTSANATTPTICAGGNTTLNLVGGGGGTGEVIHWYTGSCGGTSVGTGNGLSVNPAVTTTYYGRYEDGAPCNYTSACVTVTVTVNTKSADPTSANATTPTICAGGNTTLNLVGGGGGTGEVIHWYTGSCGGTSVGTGNGLSVSPAVTTIYYGRYEDGAPCNYTSACVTVTVTVSPFTVGGSLTIDGTSPPSAIKTVCSSGDVGSITLSGITGSVQKWQSSTNGGASWADSSNNTTTLNYNVSKTTLFRAVIQSGPCSVAYSTNAVISVVPRYTPSPVVANPSTICAGDTSTLTASTGFAPTGIADSSGDFHNANPSGWCMTDYTSNPNAARQCSGSFLPANGDNQQVGQWRETNPHPFGISPFVWFTTPVPKFALANGNYKSYLETPVFSLLGQPTAILNFIQAYDIRTGGTATIEISTDGGNNYTVLKQYNPGDTYGLKSGGTNIDTLRGKSDQLDLTSYIGLANLRLRFNYSGSDNSAWILDNVNVPAAVPVTYLWKDTSSIQTYITPLNATPFKVTPDVTTKYAIVTYINGCPSDTGFVTVTVNPLPTITLGANPSVCQGSPSASISFTSTNNPNKYSITYGDNAINAGFLNVSGAALSASPGSINLVIPSAATANTYSGILTVTNANQCSGASVPFTVTVKPIPVVQNPLGGSRCDAGSVPLSATASVGTLNWYDAASESKLIGTGSPVNTPNISTTTTYYVEATNNGCTSARVPVTATINSTAVVTTAPATVPLCPQPFGTLSALFSVTATNAAGYQWQVNTGSGFTDIAGATNDNVTISNVTEGMEGYQYRVSVTSAGGCSTINSEPASLYIKNVWKGATSRISRVPLTGGEIRYLI